MSPSTRVVELLQQLGADVVAVDPHVQPGHSHAGIEVERIELTAEGVEAADAVLLLVGHDAFDLDVVRSEARYVLDTRRRLDGPSVEHL